MKWKLGWCALITAGLLAGVIIGYELRKSLEPTGQQIAAAMTRQMPEVGLLMGADLRPMDTAVEDWLYPNSERLDSSSAMSGSKNGQPFEFFTASEMRSSDSFEKVVEHYSSEFRRVLNLAPDDVWSLVPDGSGSAGFNGVLLSYAMSKRGGERPVQVGDIGMLAKNCNLHLSISRGDREQSTFITVWFSKWPVDE